MISCDEEKIVCSSQLNKQSACTHNKGEREGVEGERGEELEVGWLK